MSRIADKLTSKIVNYFDDGKPDKKIQKAVIAVGVRAAIKYLHYQSMKNIYQIRKD